MLKTKGLLSQGIAFFTFAVILVCLLNFYAFNSLDLAAFLSLNLSQQRFYSSKIPNNKNDNTNKLNSSLSQKDEMHHVRMLSNLNPFYISGFADAESCFSVIICKKKEYKIGWYVILAFIIRLHSKDIALLKQIQAFFGVGNISIGKDGSATYSVQSIKDLINEIIPHFLKYPLNTKKQADFLLFKSIIDLMNYKEHFNADGLQEIVNIRASMNNGLSDKLKAAFPNTKPVNRPAVDFKGIPDPNWLVGFTDGEGCFCIGVQKSQSYSIGFQVELTFSITQHSRDTQLMKSLVEYLDCGRYIERPDRFAGVFTVNKLKDIEEKIIPLFNQYPLQGVKSLDYADFKRVAEIIKDKGHLTASGLDQIRKIKSGMNSGRNHG